MQHIRTLLLCAALVPFAAVASAQVTTPDPVAPQPTPAVVTPEERLDSSFIVSGLLGSTFGDAVEDASFNFTGSVGYLWTQRVGAEFMAGFSPNTSLPGLADTSVNSYMINAILALPLGFDAQWQPYLSGGLGGLTMGSTEDVFGPLASENTLAGNVGFGLMGYGDQVGFRVDVRRISQLGDDADTAPILNDHAFWRANAGIAFRW